MSRMIEKILKAVRIWGKLTIAISSLIVWAYVCGMFSSKTVSTVLFIISFIAVMIWVLENE